MWNRDIWKRDEIYFVGKTNFIRDNPENRLWLRNIFLLIPEKDLRKIRGLLKSSNVQHLLLCCMKARQRQIHTICGGIWFKNPDLLEFPKIDCQVFIINKIKDKGLFFFKFSSWKITKTLNQKIEKYGLHIM